MARPGSFRRHLIATYTLVSLVPVVVLGVVFLGYLGTCLRTDIERETDRLAAEAEAHLGDVLQRPEAVLAFLSGLLAERAEPADAGTPSGLLADALAAAPWFDALALVSRRVELQAGARRGDGGRVMPDGPAIGPAHRRVVAAVLAGRPVVWSDVVSTAADGAARVLLGWPHGGGVLLGALQPAELDHLLVAARPAQTALFAVIDAAGTVLYSYVDADADETAPALLARLHRAPAEAEAACRTPRAEDGLPLCAVRRVAHTGWSVMVVPDSEDPAALLRTQRITFLTAAALALLMAIGVATLMSDQVIRPVAALSRNIRRIAEGDPDRSPDLKALKAYDEFRALAAEFLLMRRNMLQRERDLRESEDRVRLILDSVGEGILGLDAEGTITFVNATAARVLLGESDGPLVGHRLEPRLRLAYDASGGAAEAGLVEASAYLLRPLRDGLPVPPQEMRLHLTDGRSVPVGVHVRPILRDGRAVGVVVSFADISDRLRAENALRESERRFRQIADFLPIAIAMYSPERGRMRYVNRAFCSLFACSPAELETVRARDFYADPDDGTRLQSLLDAQSQVDGVELRLRRPTSGEIRWAAVYLRRIRVDGEACILSGVIDLTARKEAELAVRQSEQRFKAFIENAPAAMAVKDVKGRYLQVNQTFRDWYSEGTEMLIGKTAAEIYPPAVAESAVEDDREVMAYQTVIRRERRMMLSSGAVRFVMMIKFPVMRDGAIAEIGVIMVDVTEQRRMKMELGKVYRAIEQSSTSIVITDAQGDIEYVNPATELVTEYSASELLGKNPRLLRSGYTSAEVYRGLWEALKAGRVWQGEFHNRKKSGALFWELATISPVHDEEGRTVNYVAVKEDITERKRSQLELEIARTKAEAASQAKSHFLMVMSHELRTPLNSIIGFSDILMKMTGPGEALETVRDYAGMINEAGTHLLSMINDILDLSKIDVGRFYLNEERVDLIACIRSSINIVRGRAAQAGIELRFEAPDQPCHVIADPKAMRQILINLLSNAVKFTDDEGCVTILVRADSETGVAVSVIDTGIGMSEIEVDKALLPFVQIDNAVNRRYQGTGLGLPLARSLVLAHGGTLEIESAVGQGTTVTTRLPPERLAG